MTDYRQLLACSNAELARVDPLVLNLLVARSIPSLAQLDIPRYERQADQMSADVRQRIPSAEKEFWKSPQDWKNDVNFFRLGILCGYLEYEAGIAYNEEQRNAKSILYTNPSDLFLNGVLDTRRGTCGNMAALHVAIGWRLGWPVSLACAGHHLVCRYDDGKVTHNIEAAQSGYGGFKSDPDEFIMKQRELPRRAITCGSDLRALTPRQMLGVFVGLRGRHMRDIGEWKEAEADYLLARWLYPASRLHYREEMALALRRGAELFEPGEIGSPESLAEEIASVFELPKPNNGKPHFESTIKGVIY
jgi:hypothetical protein